MMSSEVYKLDRDGVRRRCYAGHIFPTPTMTGTRTPVSGILSALAAAILFGASVPLIKPHTGNLSPLMLAGLLYLGSGLGLLGALAIQRLSIVARPDETTPLHRPDLPWLAAAVLAGGVIGPVLLVWGLDRMPASGAALLLNLEGVLTALIAWTVFHEHVDRRIALGLGLIVAGGLVLAWPRGAALAPSLGALAVTGAALAWAVDNNLTRRVAANDPLLIAGLKGLVAGLVNTALGLTLGGALPNPGLVAGLLGIGLAGYGLSLVLFVLALRELGAARTGAWFSVAPFVGALLAMPLLGERPGVGFWTAAALMAAGLWLHLTERHSHGHTHESLTHSHRHRHDEHHRHEHDFPWDGSEPHAHAHTHTPLTHSHPHYPDIHHRHRH